MIEIQNLVRTYGAQRAVDDITFSVARGEIVGFLGPNGAGKTTTMKIVTCYMPPTEGRVTVEGLDVTENSLEVRRKIGYLPEINPLYGDMNVVDFLRYIAALRSIINSEQTSRNRQMVDTCGVGDVLHKNISQLSKGYRQRVGLAQAMIHGAKVLQVKGNFDQALDIVLKLAVAELFKIENSQQWIYYERTAMDDIAMFNKKYEVVKKEEYEEKQ
jgi:ABC-2 type transport system ATP-binding protein